MEISQVKKIDAFYPEKLKEIDKAPEKLYFRGTLMVRNLGNNTFSLNK
jgi:predicted Rossmann fold nucleotide-binding protein DprA/Smf involved in DNA uptake